jgi:hypothetical protein
MDKSYTSSDFTIIDKIKTALIDGLYNNFGYDKNLYIADIVRITKSVPGVRNCRVLKPAHDIEFNYDIHETLTQEQLLTYSPDLVYIDVSSISIVMRS